MEIVQEIIVTASVAILLSFLVAKLVSVAMAGGGGGGGRGVEMEPGVGSEFSMAEEMVFGERLRVSGFESETRVEFVEEEETTSRSKVDEFESERSVSVDQILEISRVGEVIVEEDCSELPENSLREDRKEEEPEVVELTESSSEGNTGEEEVVEDRVSDCDIEKVEEGKLESLVEEEEEMVEKVKVNELGIEKATDDAVVDQSEDTRVMRDEEEGEGLNVSDEDDWEGIERSELEKDFAAATSFVNEGGTDGKTKSFGSDVKMQLIELRKIATESPCHEPALKMSARAKWNAWQRQRNMSPELAMEQYIALLSDKVPGWMEADTPGESEKNILKVGIPSLLDPDSSTSLSHQTHPTNEREPELNSGNEGVDESSNSAIRDKE